VAWEVRIGVHSGPAIAGSLGEHGIDIWGDTVNIASRMESHGEVGAITCPQSAYERLRDRWEFEPMGKTLVKGMGEIDMWKLKEPLTAP